MHLQLNVNILANMCIRSHYIPYLIIIYKSIAKLTGTSICRRTYSSVLLRGQNSYQSFFPVNIFLKDLSFLVKARYYCPLL